MGTVQLEIIDTTQVERKRSQPPAGPQHSKAIPFKRLYRCNVGTRCADLLRLCADLMRLCADLFGLRADIFGLCTYQNYVPNV